MEKHVGADIHLTKNLLRILIMKMKNMTQNQDNNKNNENRNICESILCRKELRGDRKNVG